MKLLISLFYLQTTRFLTVLNANRYDGHLVQRGTLIPARQFDPAIHQKEVGEKFYADKNYCNNFVFHKQR
jgi:hypothetical protein